MLTRALKAHVKNINVKKNYWHCGVFNSLNIKFFVSLMLSKLSGVFKWRLSKLLNFLE
jgi:hypothetical protein